MIVVAGGVSVPVIVALGAAARRSARRQECAQLRDRLVDAARTGELDVTDRRVFGLIDWFDQVATTGRTGTRGRHGPDRPNPSSSMVDSLAAALQPVAGRPLAERALAERPLAQQVESPGAEGDLWDVAVAYRAGRQRSVLPPGLLSRLPAGSSGRLPTGSFGRRPALMRRQPARERRVVVTGTAAPADALMRPNGWAGPSSLVEEIFAVAGGGR